MATTSITPTVNPSKFPVVFPARPDLQITQVELALYLSLKGRLEQLQAQVTAAEDDLKARLGAGASVQPGDRFAYLDKGSRRNVAWKKVSQDLGDCVFGEGQGATYCEEVLASTEPTITTSLVVR